MGRAALAKRREGVERSAIPGPIDRVPKHQLRDTEFYRKTAAKVAFSRSRNDIEGGPQAAFRRRGVVGRKGPREATRSVAAGVHPGV